MEARRRARQLPRRRAEGLETAVVSSPGAARHGNPLDIGDSQLVHTCRIEAQAAVDNLPDNLDAARSLGAAMTFDDLINYTLDTLDTPASALEHAEKTEPTP